MRGNQTRPLTPNTARAATAFARRSLWQYSRLFADKLFLELIREAHKRDIRIIIDGVFHCTGSTFWAFEDVVKNQERSKYKDWYTIKRWDDPSTAANEFDYQGW